jgi:DNA-binding GntR family transcriptional regulator
MQIKRETPVPYHYQIEKILEKEIQDGKYTIKEFLPSERELSSNFNLSKITIKGRRENVLSGIKQ